MINAILVATDASPQAKRAVDWAAEIAARFGASLNLLHVIRDMQLPEELRSMAEVEKIEGQRLDVLRFVGQKILAEATQRAAAKGAEEVRSAIGEGDPANTILHHARNNGVDLIVLGTRGLGSVKGTLLGSVSRKVTNLSEINCLTVK